MSKKNITFHHILHLKRQLETTDLDEVWNNLNHETKLYLLQLPLNDLTPSLYKN